MAFSSLGIHCGEILTPAANPQAVSALAAAIAANCSSLSSLGGASAVAFGALAFVKGYRAAGDPQATNYMSANAQISVAASSTLGVITLQFTAT